MADLFTYLTTALWTQDARKCSVALRPMVKYMNKMWCSLGGTATRIYIHWRFTTIVTNMTSSLYLFLFSQYGPIIANKTTYFTLARFDKIKVYNLSFTNLIIIINFSINLVNLTYDGRLDSCNYKIAIVSLVMLLLGSNT